MIDYKSCSDVSMSEIFEAFSLGFSDYIIPLTMDQDDFAARFFGPEGNSLNLSFIALDENRPVGLILGGIRLFDNLKTMRCGTMCVAPAYRGQGVSNKLFELHMDLASNNQCKQLFLEVIKSNDRAVKFYEKYDYRPVYTLKYYSIMKSSLLSDAGTLNYTLKEIPFDTVDSFRRSLYDCHINWQSDTPSYAGSANEVFLCAYDGNKKAALIAMSPQGKINLIWVGHEYRNQGLGRSMLQKAAQMQNIEKVGICLPSNASIEGFLRKLGFEKQSIEQYEMYLPLQKC